MSRVPSLSWPLAVCHALTTKFVDSGFLLHIEVEESNVGFDRKSVNLNGNGFTYCTKNQNTKSFLIRPFDQAGTLPCMIIALQMKEGDSLKSR